MTSGLARAGEGYFSPDGTSIIFQAVPERLAVDLPPAEARRGRLPDLPRPPGRRRPARMVSTGKGRCTCPYFHPSGKSILFASTHLNPSTEAEPSKGPAYSRTDALPMGIPRVDGHLRRRPRRQEPRCA